MGLIWVMKSAILVNLFLSSACAKNLSLDHPNLNSTELNHHTQMSVTNKLMNFVHSTFGNSEPLTYEYKTVIREHDASMPLRENQNDNNAKNHSKIINISKVTSRYEASLLTKPSSNIPCNEVTPPNNNSFNIYYRNQSMKIDINSIQSNSEELLLVWNSGVDALGNALLGYLTTYWDAMRSGRKLVASKYGMIQMLGEVFDLGVEFVDKKLDYDHSNPTSYTNDCPNILFDYGKLSKEAPIVYRHGQNGPYLPGGKLACSRIKNFHFDRPPANLIGCYFKKLNCMRTPRDCINPAKQGDSVVDSCGEKGALRQLFLGPSVGLQSLEKHFATSHWAGSPARLHQLFYETRNAKKPIWDAALHLRVQFGFVESGIDERDPKAVADVEAWLANPETKSKLQRIVSQLKHYKTVYVASETALVRRHVSDMIRAQVGKNSAGSSNGRHYSVKDLKSDETRAHSFFPYLEWWALAHSKKILVHRHQSLSVAPSTYSGSAHIYGGWS